jgi:tartrate dehydratase alpha subunit/fumarate hydratase class I-like protein
MASFCDRSAHVPEGPLTGSDNTEAITHGVYDAYKFLFMAKGGGSANKSFPYQKANVVLARFSFISFILANILS